MKQRLDLSVRDLARPSSSAFDTRRRAVTRWAAELPVANLDDMGQRLRHALAEVNGLAIPRARRLHLLETFGPKARMALDHLRRRYANQPLPLTAADGAAQQAIDLLSELMRGYRTLLGQIITDGKPLPIWRRVWLRDTLVLSLHRFIHYGGELLAVYQAMHCNPPEGLWKRINRCYLLAEAHGLTGLRVASPANAKMRTRINEEYRLLLLLSLIPVDGITPMQWRDVRANLKRWLGLTALARPPFVPGQQVYAVRLGRDGGPQPVSSLDDEALASQNTRALVITPLRTDLKTRLAREGRRRFWRRETTVAPEVLQFLLEHWCTEFTRAEQRDAREGPADVIVGLAALHHLLGGKATPVQQEESSSSDDIPTLSLAPLPDAHGHHLGVRASAVDVWQSVYVDPQKVCPVPSAPQDWRTQTRIDETYRVLPARLVDRSGHGCGVRMTRDGVRSVATGMLIALRTAEDDTWNVGLIARVTAHSNAVELGVRLAGDAPVPAVLHTRSARGIGRFPAVIGRDDKGRRLLFAPAVPAVREGELVLELGEHPVPVRRVGNGAYARHVFVLAVEPLRPDDERHFDTVPVKEVKAAEAPARPASHASAPVHKAGTSADDPVERLMAATGMSREDAEFFLAAEAAHDEGVAPRLKSGGQ